MQKYILMAVLLSLSLAAPRAQNLVPNPSFESYGVLPCSWISSVNSFNMAMNDWSMPSDGSSDIFSLLVQQSCYAHCYSTHNSAVGHQSPRTGNVMSAILTYGAGCGFMPNYREYLQVPLTSPLVPGQNYYVEYYVSLGDFVDNASNNFGAYFSTAAMYIPTCFVLSYTPQINETTIITDTANWTKISGTFTATAAFTHMIIGNFYNNSSTSIQYMGGPSTNSRYFVDDVSVQLVGGSAPVAAFASSDSVFCEKQCIDFFDLTQNNPTSWQWSFVGGSPSSSTDQNPTSICYNNYGAFDVQLIACNSVACDTIIYSNFITEYQSPVITIYQSGDTLYAPSSLSYAWYQSGAPTVVLGTSPYYVPLVSGNYYVVATDSLGCETASNVIGVPLSLHSQLLQNVNLYVLENNLVATISDNTVCLTITLYDATGRQVNNWSCKQNNQFALHAEPGLYTARVTTNKGELIKKLLVTQ